MLLIVLQKNVVPKLVCRPRGTIPEVLYAEGYRPLIPADSVREGCPGYAGVSPIRVEIYHNNHLVGMARLVDAVVNGRTYR